MENEDVSSPSAGARPASAERSPTASHSPAIPGLELQEARVYRGPNPYGYRPVVRVQLSLGRLEEFPTDRLGDFSARLVELLPGLREHGCSYGEPGGFLRRLERGTWLAHVMEHVALELQGMAGTPVTYGKTRGAGPRGVYNVVYSYLEEHVGLLAGWLALRVLDSLLPQELRGVRGLSQLVPRDAPPLAPPDAPLDLPAELEALIRIAERLALGPTTRSLVDEARQRGIPAIRLDDQSFVQLGYGKYQQRIRASVTGRSSHLAVETASDKALTNQLLHDAGIPVPQSVRVRTAEEAVAAAERLGYPVVTKPLDVSHGRGVSLNLMSPEQVRWGYEQAAQYRTSVLVERFLTGQDYRVLVIDGKVEAAARRVPAHVVGDGRHTIAELIEQVNQDPRRGIGHEKVLTRITVDAQASRLLDQAGCTLESVLPDGEILYLRATANMSTGGTAVDCTDEMHPENVELAALAARVIGLDVAGIDLICPDITRSVRETGGGIIEVNAGPGFRMHLQPSEGRPRDVAAPVINSLFPPGLPTRVPIAAITGTNGKTTTSRMVAHILRVHGLRVGLTTSTGIYVDGRLFLAGDTTGPKSACMVLRDPTVEAAVLETARGGILREGLGFDRCDVGAVLNVAEDHLGLKGVETLEDLAWVKSLVVEVVREDGYSVLNADDPRVAAMRRRAGGRVIYFSMDGGQDGPDHLKRHVARGGIAVVRQSCVRGDMIAIHDGDQYHPLMWSHQIPATMGGLARFNVQNSLAAAAIAYALKVPVATIREALATFETSFEENPGRLNVYDGHPFRVILDYAHNPHGMEQIAEMVRAMRPNHQRILAVVTGTGDRRDQDIRALGEIAARMADEVIVKETTLLRGRRRGEVPRLVGEGLAAAGMPGDRISYFDNEREALDAALGRARAGDLVIIFCDDSKDCWQHITSYRVPPPTGDLSRFDVPDDESGLETPARPAGLVGAEGRG